MKTVNIETFLTFRPCYAEAKIREIANGKDDWTALEILRLENVSDQDKLWSVLREEFIDANLLHEFSCRVAEKALLLIPNPDMRSVKAIEAKRAWLRGEIDTSELSTAWAAASDAASDAAWAAARAEQVAILIEMLEKHELDSDE